jgi:hypothetical protein
LQGRLEYLQTQIADKSNRQHLGHGRYEIGIADNVGNAHEIPRPECHATIYA